MSAITQVSSYARYVSLVRSLGNAQNNVDTLSQQLTTGKKSTDLAAYGPETQKLLDLRSELVKRDNYIQNIDTALPRVQATDKVLTALEKIASDWQSSNLMPFEPGPPTVSSSFNANPSGMKVTVNEDLSSFKANSNFTVTAIPSVSGANGSFDVTVTDGLGGRTTQTINLAKTPPGDGKGWNFTIAGGPGDGAVVNLSFDPLTSAAYSTFDVSYPLADDMADRVEGALRDVRQYLNERFGDRYLFAGSRFDTEPVKDLMTARQTSKVTLNGSIVEEDDYFEITVNGQTFSYQVQAADTKTITFVAQQLTSQINAADPAFDIAVTTKNGVITLIADNPGEDFTVSTAVDNRTTVENTANNATTTAATAVAGQIDSFSFNGDGVDIGDTFEIEIEIGDPDDPYNLNYYLNNPTEPTDLPVYQKYTVSYTVTEADYAAGVTSTSRVADQLRTNLAALSPAPPVALDASDPGTGQPIVLVSNRMLDTVNHPNYTTMMTTTPVATNGSIQNTMTVSTLPYDTSPSAKASTTDDPYVPYYDTDYESSRTSDKAWDKSRVSADDGLSLEYGVVSTDPAFQTLIEAFRFAHAAATHPGNYKEYSDKSLELMAKAKDMLSSVHSKVASDAATLDTKKVEHTELKNGVIDQMAKIEGVDQTEVAARLSSANTALEAAYTVAAKRQQLSLINYIA